jgi:L-rhamnose-H+ transport protein
MPFAILLTVIGGFSNGSFALPMKPMKNWAWEHGWFAWALSGLVLIPCAAALLTIPNLGEVYTRTSLNTHLLVMLFGFLWGISGLLFGIGIERLGLALGYGIILGLSSALGAIGPFIAKHPDRLFTPAGFTTLAGVLLVVAGVASCAVAGRIREKTRGAERRGSLRTGLLICIASGAGAPMMNFGLSYSTEIIDNARLAGATENYLVNASWPVLLAAGFLANGGYCLYLMARGSGVRPLVTVFPARNHSLGFLMGALWMGGLLMFGYASRLMGPLGLVLGWPIMMGCTVIAANFWGAVTGEWNGAPPGAKVWIAVGVCVLIVGIGVIGIASGL